MKSRAIDAAANRSREAALQLELLEKDIRRGVSALERGDFVEIDDEGLDTLLDELVSLPAPKR
ncbi:hypothetical protein [Rhodopseudomonas sp. AAP120]|uniref:hypothetical protein n=1 Tax=Rhodopseudomonas sp. AAP120 TaxID=1523430 RepID=UPI000AFF488F|nr:hypothetical protein [Rhodopseudomonas sp. AAP120]